jgi:sodium-dependent dicarboxylate transporter 2/3/5
VLGNELDELPGGKKEIDKQIAQLGPTRKEEKRIMGVFSLVAAAWILRGFIDIKALAMVTDSSIAITGALALFIIPSDLKQREFLLDWATAVKIPWGIVVLFGGGFALAAGFQASELTGWIAGQLGALQHANTIILVAAIALVVVFLTEVTSNTATAALLLPVMGALAVSIGIHPLVTMITTAVAASFAFMLPVATPPNAIVFSSQAVTIPQMAKAGLVLNLIGVVLITVFVMIVLPLLGFNIDH